jgi:hypothetical protein
MYNCYIFNLVYNKLSNAINNNKNLHIVQVSYNCKLPHSLQFELWQNILSLQNLLVSSTIHEHPMSGADKRKCFRPTEFIRCSRKARRISTNMLQTWLTRRSTCSLYISFRSTISFRNSSNCKTAQYVYLLTDFYSNIFLGSKNVANKIVPIDLT